MKKLILGTFFTLASFSSLALAGDNINSDPIGDIHYNFVGACPSPAIDIIRTNFKRVESEYVVEMEMSKKIEKTSGYREYYFWMDVTHDKARGYQPYLPDSVAWPDLYANYRIFYSTDANNGSYSPNRYAREKVLIQDCISGDCSRDESMRYESRIQVSVNENKVTFTWPVGLLPDLDKSQNIRVGYTTYFEYMNCNGEDDSPQWSEKAFRIKLPKISSSPSAR